MNEREALQVYGLIGAAWPAWRSTDATPSLWAVMLADLDYDATVQAVRRLVATDDGWPSVAKVRRQVAQDAGLLAPDPDVAWAEVHARCSLPAGRRPVWSHPAVAEATEAVGGWPAIRSSTAPEVIRGQWRRAYETAAERDRTRVCAPGGDVASLSHRQAILDAPDKGD